MKTATAFAFELLVPTAAQQNGGAPQHEDWYQNVINGGRSVTVRIPKPVPVRIGA